MKIIQIIDLKNRLTVWNFHESHEMEISIFTKMFKAFVILLLFIDIYDGRFLSLSMFKNLF